MPRLTKGQRERKAIELVKAVLDGDQQRVDELDRQLGGKLARAKRKHRGER